MLKRLEGPGKWNGAAVGCGSDVGRGSEGVGEEGSEEVKCCAMMMQLSRPCSTSAASRAARGLDSVAFGVRESCRCGRVARRTVLAGLSALEHRWQISRGLRNKPCQPGTGLRSRSRYYYNFVHCAPYTSLHVHLCACNHVSVNRAEVKHTPLGTPQAAPATLINLVDLIEGPARPFPCAVEAKMG